MDGSLLMFNLSPESLKARELAMRSHGDQKYGEHPYIVHLDAVADICYPYGQNAVIIAFLHDTLEDTSLSR